ncbi:MAG: hypothetical protein RIR76_1546, partial [Verrucomicrobiota bacterium]
MTAIEYFLYLSPMKSPLLSLLASLVLTASAVAQSVTITPSATTYSSAGGQITVSVAFGFATPTSLPKAIAFEVTAPAGWSYGSGYV